MLAMLLAAALQAGAPAIPPPPFPQPDAEAEALGKRLAAAGGLAALIPLVIEKDLADLAGEDPALTPDEKAQLLAIGRARGREGLGRLTDALGHGYATRLSPAELRALVATAESPAARQLRAVEPFVIVGALQALGGLDLKKETAEAFCKQTGKLCRRD
jgi:hypothetical protein